MIRYFFEVAYHGKKYHGWQRQPNAITVQQVLEETLSTLLRSEISIMGSGRTDTGVHCAQQFFHIDCEEIRDIEKLKYRLNGFLPPDISIADIFAVTNDTHARFTATSRSYEYRIIQKKSPFLNGLVYYYTKDLNVTTMNEAASFLIGEKDFEAFSKVKTDVNTFFCNITNAKWEEVNDGLIFHVTANRFLRGMVRALVGTLLNVGEGKVAVEDFNKIIESKDRKKAGASAPAEGLFLTRVEYPKEIYL